MTTARRSAAAWLALLTAGCLACSSSAGDTAPPTDASDVDGALEDWFPPVDIRADVPDADAPGEVVHFPSCTTDTDCPGATHCLASYEGRSCLPECLTQDACPPGYFCRAMNVQDETLLFVCLPDLPQLCLPCAAEAPCTAGRCVQIDGEDRCTTFCSAAEACPEGYACAEIGVADPEHPELGVCLPQSGSCDCTAETEGQKRPCFRVGPGGTCHGFESCDLDQGWVDCDAPEPAAEACDGVDNDCDGVIDDEVPASTPCEQVVEGIGTCTGTAICGGQSGWLCDARTPAAETCDYLDDDCDGLTDEDFRVGDVYGVLAHCGACNVTCVGSIPHGTAFCDASQGTPICAVQACDEGYYAVGKVTCQPVDVPHCQPCSSDSHCGGGQCLSLDDASFCVLACQNDVDCPEGLGCVERLDHTGAVVGSFCLPPNGTCDCTADQAGEVRACAISNEAGTCFGAQTCDPELGWIDCSARIPLAEVCDGYDNDCDGAPDDGLPLDGPCTIEVPGVGTCPGVARCFGSQGWFCDAPAPGAETCDGSDNDCDGLVDEDFTSAGLYLLPQNCGACGVNCAERVPNAESACQPGPDGSPRCVVVSCAPGFYPVSETQCLRTSTVLCAPCGADADCRGGTCLAGPGGLGRCAHPCDQAGACPEGYVCDAGVGGPEPLCVPASGDCQCTGAQAGLTRPCLVTSAFGTCAGLETCDPAVGWVGCDAALPVVEDCNGLDDDCDGGVDEGLGAPEPCQVTNGFGACQGERRCLAGAWTCTAATPAAEVCNYLDDDCDGVVDDPFRQDGVYGLDTDCGGCESSCVGAVPNGLAACSPVDGGAACTVQSCDPGYVKLNDFACVEQPAILCVPCTSGDDCLGATCHDAGQGGYCATDCAVDGCPDGYACTDVAGGAKLCLPQSGSCDCAAATDGQRRLCQTTGPAGTCNGTSTCDADTGWGPCDAPAPAQEACNGLDDDCDGLIDEGLLEPVPCERTTAAGSCPGTARCLGSGGVVCDAREPMAETCNFLDDDCDGLTDEDFTTDGLYDQVANCGTCGRDCTGAIAHATAGCGLSTTGSPTCVVIACDEGYVPNGVHACVLPPHTSCQPCDADADCFGATCANLDGQLFCLEACASPDACADGYACRDVPGVDGLRCVPAGGSCSCTNDNDGARRVCSYSNAAGTCQGVETCHVASGWTPCDARVPANETCNGLDDDCDGALDEGLPATEPCERTNAEGSCSGEAVCVGALGWVCDAPAPQAEVCDGVDNDCDGASDEAGSAGCDARFPDADADGFGAVGEGACLCEAEGAGTAPAGGDCDDDDALVSPAAGEICNDVDDDCDGLTDEEGAGACTPHYLDGDGDGYGAGGSSRCLCQPEAPFVTPLAGDCDDAKAAVHPGAPETCHGPDLDCDGLVGEEGSAGCTPRFRDVDGDGFGQADDPHCLCAPVAPYTVLVGGDCDDQIAAIHPDAPEVCNLFDDDCDGVVDVNAGDCATFFRDDDGDGFGVAGDLRCRCLPEPPYRAVAAGDCDDGDAAVSPVAVEVCNGLDDDCDGTTDQGLGLAGCRPFYADGDGDGFGVDATALCACAAPPGHPAEASGDCDDTKAAVHPGAAEPCNGLDDDCDGATDEGAGDLDGDGRADCVDPCPVLVDVGAAAGGDGSVAHPFRTVQAGLTGVGACDEVWVRPGTYAEHVDFGGRNVRVWAMGGAAVTTLDGGGAGSVVTFASDEGPGAVLEGFTVRGGRGTVGAAPWGDPAGTYGGGVLVLNAAPTLRGCVIRDNQVTRLGGGVFFHASAGTLQGGSVLANTSSSTGNAGAGVALQASTARVLEALIRGNTTPGYGGGVLLLETGGELRYSRVVANQASQGAGVRIGGYGTTIVDGNVIADNLGEGVSFRDYSSTRFIDNTVVGNQGHGLRVDLGGGATFSVPLIKNVIVAYNDGNGVRTDSNVDFGLFFTDAFGNSSANYGGVMGNLANSALGITTRNCLFRTYSDDANPDNDDLRLQASSPCIDSGGDVTLYFVTRDLDGEPRPVVGAGGAFPQYDRGAFEFQVP